MMKCIKGQKGEATFQDIVYCINPTLPSFIISPYCAKFSCNMTYTDTDI